jgi:hypothetical protein
MYLPTLSTTASVVKPLPGPNWPLQPVVTAKLPHVAAVFISVSLAGCPVTVNVQGVVGAEWVSMTKLQVQLLLSSQQVRSRPSMVHCAVVIMDLAAAGDGAGAANAMVARMVLTANVVKYMMKEVY